MNIDEPTGARRPISLAVVLAAALVGGCVSYTQSQLSPMSAADICELEYMQGRNLTPESKQALRSELQRRNDNCGNHAAEVRERFAAFMYRETYGKHDNP